MSFFLTEGLLAIGLFCGMLLLFEVGRRMGIARRSHLPDGVDPGSGPVEAAVFGLFGLMLAFTFSGAASRFEDRRHLITEEANAIGTAYLRLDLLPADAQSALRPLFARYLKVRTEIYQNAEDVETTNARSAEANSLQLQIWSMAVTASQRHDGSPDAGKLLLPALNEMIDITTTRAVATQNHPPRIIFFLLFALCLVSALLAGQSTVVRSWFHKILYSGTMSSIFFVIIDLEYPRFGLIRIDEADRVLQELGNLVR